MFDAILMVALGCGLACVAGACLFGYLLWTVTHPK